MMMGRVSSAGEGERAEGLVHVDAIIIFLFESPWPQVYESTMCESYISLMMAGIVSNVRGFFWSCQKSK